MEVRVEKRGRKGRKTDKKEEVSDGRRNRRKKE